MNLDPKTVAGFGDEWRRFDQSGLSIDELRTTFDEYFSVFPLESLSRESRGFDAGCGSGRWARFVAPRVCELHCIDASTEALEVAKRNLGDLASCRFHLASVDDMPLSPCSMDFGYCLGVLHHVPDTSAGLTACVEKLKPGAPFLLYLYYAFDNRPLWFRSLWKLSDLVRKLVSRFPAPAKYVGTFLIAGIVYLPLARFARVVERVGGPVEVFPLSYYRNRSFYLMRADAYDRFGTSLEQRFTRNEIEEMMVRSGLERIAFAPTPPHWCAVGFRAETSSALHRSHEGDADKRKPTRK